MDDLPPVNDDFDNMLQAVRMFGILEENTFAYKNVNHEQVEKVYQHVTNTIFVRTRPLQEDCGIYSAVNPYDKGLDWMRLRENAMKEGASPDYAIVRLCFC